MYISYTVVAKKKEKTDYLCVSRFLDLKKRNVCGVQLLAVLSAASVDSAKSSFITKKLQRNKGVFWMLP
jgi:hypothetical protein